MDTEGTYDSRGTRSGPPVPRPAGPPPAAPPKPTGLPRPGLPPAVPPVPAGLPAAGPSTAEWLNTVRPTAAPGVWRYGHVPRSAERPPRPSLLGPLIALALWLLLWALLADLRIPYVKVPLMAITPGDWWLFESLRAGYAPAAAYSIETLYIQILVLIAGVWAARVGHWAGLFQYWAGPRPDRARLMLSGFGALLALWLVWSGKVPLLDVVLYLIPQSWLQGGGNAYLAALVAYGAYALVIAVIVWPFARAGHWRTALRDRAARRATTGPQAPQAQDPSPVTGTDAAQWPELRAAGRTDAADVLGAAVRAGRMNDVDCVRLSHAWARARTRHDGSASFDETVARQGADAFLHPSGRRDLPLRTARHDLLAGQVRIGGCPDDERNPYARRGSGVALDPAVLGTSLLAVGPPGAGKTALLVRPVVETLALQALTGGAAVLAVGAAGAALGPDDAYDVVVKIGDPASVHDFDLYGGSTDPDEAAALLAEGLAGDVPGLDGRRAALALGQLLGPYRAVHGHFPAVPVLRELLAGDESALGGLRDSLEAGGHSAMLRELDARIRQAGGAGDPATVLADRIALLDRPAFAGFFTTGEEARPFSLPSLGQHPLRVRIDLPERTHAGASRVLARLVLAQFNAVAAARTDRSIFACLLLDDATHTVTAETVQGLRRLRSVNAGAVLALRTIDDVPEGLHAALLGAVGCGMIFSGVTTWDGKRFSETWGKEWVSVREVAQHGVFADQPFTRAMHALRKLATGKAVTVDAVTVRQVERERWSASALAYELPARHAVLSLTTVDGEHAPPLLVDLNG
ncbi:ATP/GTP-binding protein [Streptomyces sp. NBC_01591]|uniref:ATP/GTP-binding protein n=1 Tax=Streptomyces sp. NBC_01591 TaxID=2975888 RepID=UPI002DD9DBC6|nr:ATP/GTP-binding protein [Streptomyces sp. NBC_01591]WSD71222.1 ATP/GTP-binding protein [Streptomyces sp. NBC_01591]